MNKPIDKFLKTIVCLLIAFCLLAAGSISMVSAQEESTAGMSVEGTFTMFGRVCTLEYDYDDNLFLAPPDQYDHDLARLSLGLALAAGRHMEHPDTQDDYLIEFLQNLGFSQFETDTYRTNPTIDSIAYGLAVKKIGDATILACAVCGGDYGLEWASNLTVGDSIRSAGFEDASQKVQAAVKEYLEKNSITGRVKLWTTGYSRAGAVSNITAADFTDAGIFEDVYAYTFATPRTTRTPGSYPNIFNIMQKEDVVPKVPLADWGYKRYGTDLFLVSPETDSDCEDVINTAKQLYQDMIGSEMVINSEINYQLRTMIDYLLTLMPDSGTYAEYLQPLIVDIIAKSDGTKDALQVLLEALQQYSTDDPVIGEELKAMRDYLGTLIQTYVFRQTLKKLPPDRWDSSFGVFNLFNAHFPFEYLAMMYASDDPEELFSDNTEFMRLVIYADADISISRDGKVIKEILSDGTELVDGKVDPYSFPDADCSPEKVVITLPTDQSYIVTVTSKAGLPQTISYTGLLFSGHTVRAQAGDLYSYLMNYGDTASIMTSVNGKTIEPSGSNYTNVSAVTDFLYSPTTAMRLENNSVVHLTISGLVNRLLLVIVILLLQMIVSIVLAIIRKKRGRKRNAVVALVWHSITAAFFAVLEVAMWFFVPILTIAKMIPGTLVFIVFCVYAIKGCRTESRRWKACWILIAAMAAYVILESLLIGEFRLWKAILLLAIYAGFMAAAFLILWKGKKHER
ncbi:MAG: hypothetical protein IKG67_02285 [Parasporobacterium sp.]|nr:hypothetical protein [Parasporobacterium sp.]